MKNTVVATTRWEYYVANIGGMIFIIGLFSWLMSLTITDQGINFGSWIFWLALLTLIIFPFALISFLSSMKTVEATPAGLTLSYIFQKHVNVIRFSEIKEMKSRPTTQNKNARSRTFRDTFTLILNDGRMFEFDRSQFRDYALLKTHCRKYIK